MVADPSRTLLIHSLVKYSAMSQMEMGLPGAPPGYPTVHLLWRIWKKLTKRLCIEGFLDCTLIWGNRSYPELDKMLHHSTWKTAGTKYMSQLFDEMVVKSFL